MKLARLLLAIFVLTAFALPVDAHAFFWGSKSDKKAESKTFDADYDTAFTACKTVLMDNGFIIEDSDFKGGLLVGSSSTDKKGIPIVTSYYSNKVISMSLIKISDTKTSIRIKVLERRTASGKTTNKVITDKKIINRIYKGLTREIKEIKKLKASAE